MVQKIKIIKITRVEVQMLPNFSTLYKQVGRVLVLIYSSIMSIKVLSFFSYNAILLS